LERDGQRVVDFGERVAEDGADEARGRRVRRTRANDDRRQPRRAAVDEPLPRVVVDEQLAHRLGRAVGRLRGLLGRVRDGLGHGRRAEGADRAREDDAGPGAEPAARFEHIARAVEIDVQSAVKRDLPLAAQDRGQVEDDARALAEDAAELLRISDVVVWQIEHHELLDGLAEERSALAEAAGEAPADKAAPARDDDANHPLTLALAGRVRQARRAGPLELPESAA